MVIAGLMDALRVINGDKEPPIYAPIAGPRGSFAFMQLTAEEMRDYYAIHPKQGNHQVCFTLNSKSLALQVWHWLCSMFMRKGSHAFAQFLQAGARWYSVGNTSLSISRRH